MCFVGTPLFKMCQWLLRTDRPARRMRSKSVPDPVNEPSSTFELDTSQEPVASTPMKLDKDKLVRRRIRANTLDLESLIQN